ncbi:pseudouridine-5'-phosphatase isoform X5 [Cryptotermes secundus]|nr:pseudouridine-5'-phosphatase isoform X5 [Cryptotermes secundus]
MFSIICGKYGKSYTFDVREKVLGTVESDSCAILVKEVNLPMSPQELLSQQRLLQREMLPKTKLMPGAERLVRHLHQHGIPIAVATSSSEESVNLKLTNHKELFSLFHHIVMASSDPEVKKGKPSPEIFQICASRFPDKPKPDKVHTMNPQVTMMYRSGGPSMILLHVGHDYPSEYAHQVLLPRSECSCQHNNNLDHFCYRVKKGGQLFLLRVIL